MKNGCFSLFLSLLVVMPGWAQSPQTAAPKKNPEADGRYANMPVEAVPFRRFTKPYYDWFVQKDTLEYAGAADLQPDGKLAKMSEVRIGVFAPVENNPEMVPWPMRLP